jgi:hypothetical protein
MAVLPAVSLHQWSLWMSSQSRIFSVTKAQLHTLSWLVFFFVMCFLKECFQPQGRFYSKWRWGGPLQECEGKLGWSKATWSTVLQDLGACACFHHECMLASSQGDQGCEWKMGSLLSPWEGGARLIFSEECRQQDKKMFYPFWMSQVVAISQGHLV